MKNRTLPALLLAAPLFASPLCAQSASALYSADGSVNFSVKLPSGQQYVELFARTNGIQNIAQGIVGTGVVNTDGTTTYSYKASGYRTGDVVEYRFYSYLPNTPGVFTPGPVENAWNTLVIQKTVAVPALKDASLYRSSYYLGDLSAKNYGATGSMAVMRYLDSSDAILGFGLNPVGSGLVVTNARLVLNVHAMKFGAGNITLSQVNDSASWNEMTVTAATAPASTLVGGYTLPAEGEASLDVTAAVAQAVKTGQQELSFLLTPNGGVFAIDTKENASGKGPVLEVTLSSAPVLSGVIDTKWYVYEQVLRSCYLNLNWTVPAGFEGSVDHYELYTTSNGGATWELWMNIYNNALINSWLPSQHVTVSVIAVSTTGEKSARSNVLSL